MNTYRNRVLQHGHAVRSGLPDSIWSGRLILMDMDNEQHWLVILLEMFFWYGVAMEKLQKQA